MKVLNERQRQGEEGRHSMIERISEQNESEETERGREKEGEKISPTSEQATQPCQTA